MKDAIDKQLNSFDAATRKAALEMVRKDFCAFNMHCHSFYSYNGYGYSPSKLVALAKELNWRGIMLVDFDVLDGVDEFLAAARYLGVKAAAGMETRVFVPEFADKEINSPGEPGIAYHLGCGFTSSSVPESQKAFAARLREGAAGSLSVATICSMTGMKYRWQASMTPPPRRMTSGSIRWRTVRHAYANTSAV